MEITPEDIRKYYHFQAQFYEKAGDLHRTNNDPTIKNASYDHRTQ